MSWSQSILISSILFLHLSSLCCFGLGTTSSCGLGELLSLLSSILLCEPLSLSLLHALVGVIDLDFSEANERVSTVSRLEHFRVINDKDVSIALPEGDTSDASELFHAELQQCLAALLFTSVKVLSSF